MIGLELRIPSTSVVNVFNCMVTRTMPLDSVLVVLIAPIDVVLATMGMPSRFTRGSEMKFAVEQVSNNVRHFTRSFA